MLLLRIAGRNLLRHGRRTLITVIAMAFGVAMVMAFTAWSDGMFKSMYDLMVRETLGHAQVHHPDYPKQRAMYDSVPEAAATLSAIQGRPEVEAATVRLYGYALLGAGDEATGGSLTGVVPSLEAGFRDMDKKLTAGRWLGEEAAGELVLGIGLAESLHVELGGEVVAVTQSADGSLGNALYKVVGVLRSGNAALDRAGAYVHLQDLQDLLALPDQVHEITVVGHTEDPDVTTTAVAAAVSEDLLVRDWKSIDPMTAQMMGMQNMTLGLLLGIVFGAAGLGILNTMLMSVFERTKELGLLIALGFKPRQVMSLVLLESLVLSLVAGVLGMGIGLGLDAYLVVYGVDLTRWSGSLQFSGVSLDPIMRAYVRPEPIVATVLALFFLGVGASLWPAARAARLRPVQAMREE